MAHLQQILCSRLTDEASSSSAEPSPGAVPCTRTSNGADDACCTAAITREARRKHHQTRRDRRRFGFDSAPRALEEHLSVAPLPATELFNTLKVETKIGEGRFGTVWRCVHPRTGAQFACKQVDKRSNLKALRREIECLTHVQGSPSVLSLAGVYESDLHAYIVTELCNGGDLFEYLSQRGPLSEEEAKALFCQLAEGMRHCHANGVIHRDIKPENVLLSVCPRTEQVTAKLADFGLSKRLSEGEMSVGWVGSDPYEAPEVVALRPYDYSADVFSLGVLLFGMLSGTWPSFLEGRVFDSASEFAWPGWRRMSRGAKRLIASMLAHDPAHRPSMEQVTRDAWISGRQEDDFALAIARLAQARGWAQRSEQKEHAQSGAQAVKTYQCFELAPGAMGESESMAVKEGDCNSESSVFSWVKSGQSTPRTISDEVQLDM